MFRFEFLSLCSRFHPNCVEILLRSYKRDLAYCLQTVAKGGVTKQRFQVRFAFVRTWYGGVAWCAREKKDQQVATVVRDRTMKLEEVSSSPY